MKQRLGAFAKTRGEKKKMFTVELIISEEGDEDEAVSQCHSFSVCPQPWRHDEVTGLFQTLYQKHSKIQSNKCTQMAHFSRDDLSSSYYYQGYLGILLGI